MKQTKNYSRKRGKFLSSRNHNNNGKVGVRVYLDHASTTPIDERVLRAMEPFFIEHFGNPGSIHREGVFAKAAVNRARNTVAKILGGHPDEIVFTSGGTEANSLAIFGAVRAAQKRGRKSQEIHIITSIIEHPSVKDVCKELEREGVLVSYVDVNENGIINLETFKKVLRNETTLVSIMYVNNEIGTIQPIREIAKAIHAFQKTRNLDRDILFHSDASQVPSYLTVVVSQLGIDLLTLDGQKIYGPKGIGMLYKRRGVTIEPILFGGNQEFNLRPGTENVPGIVGFAEALQYATTERDGEVKRITGLRDYFIKKILNNIKGADLNGDKNTRLANNINISFPGAESEWVVLQLDAAGIAVGSKSACLSQEESDSYVVTVLGKSDAHAQSSVRFTLGKSTTKKDIDYTVEMLVKLLMQQ